MTISGKPANFIAGGEFAVPTVVGVSGASAVTTDFRAYGAIISFTPYLLDKDLIRLQVSPEFSQIDTATTVGGVPGLTTRSVTYHGRIAGRADAGPRRPARRVDEKRHPVRLALDRQAPWAAQRDPQRDRTDRARHAGTGASHGTRGSASPARLRRHGARQRPVLPPPATSRAIPPRTIAAPSGRCCSNAIAPGARP